MNVSPWEWIAIGVLIGCIPIRLTTMSELRWKQWR